MFYCEPIIFDRVQMNGLDDLGGDKFRWDLSPTSFSDAEDDFGCVNIKTECCLDDVFRSSPRLVPTASPAATAASLQSAFCKKPSQQRNLINQHNVMQNEVCGSSVKAEVSEGECSSQQQQSNSPYTYAHTILPGQNTEISTGDGSEPAADAQQMDIYRDLILRHLIQDISTTCARLGLPTDPYHWTAEHGWKWISEMCQQFSLPPPRQMHLSGRALLAMNQKDFENMAPEGGDTLHAQLQLWKTAFESYQQQQSSSSHANQGAGIAGMTAADNSMTKNWMPDQASMTPTAPKTDFSNGFPDPMSMSAFYNGNSFQSPPPDSMQNAFFGNGVLPSPSNSDMSSSPSMNDMGDEDLEMQLNILNMQQGQMAGGMPFNGIMAAGSRMPAGARPVCAPSGPPGQFRPPSGTVHLWHFIRELLDHPKQYGSCVRWVDREEGTFKIESSHHLARFWGQRKNRSQMNYDKLSRSLRQYYKKGIIQKPEKKQRLVYKFLPPYNL